MTRRLMGVFAVCLVAGWAMVSSADGVAPRTDEHQHYAETLWSIISEAGTGYTGWRQTGEQLELPGPTDGPAVKTFLNRMAAGNPADPSQRSVVVTEHSDDAGQLLAVTVRYKSQDGYDARYADWYWAHYLPDGTVLKTSADKSPFCKAGFVTVEDDGRVWVFPEISADLVEFFEKGEPGKCVIRPGVGPMAVTLKSSEMETITAYVAAQDGFETFIKDGRLWVFPKGSAAVREFKASGEPAKFVTRPGAGPLGITVRAPDSEVIDSYLRVALVPSD